MSAGLFSCTAPDRVSSPRGRPCRAVQQGLTVTGASAPAAPGTRSPPRFQVLIACKGAEARWVWPPLSLILVLDDTMTSRTPESIGCLHFTAWSRLTPPPYFSLKYACVSGCGLQRVSIRAGVARRCFVLHHVSRRPVPCLHHDCFGAELL